VCTWKIDPNEQTLQLNEHTAYSTAYSICVPECGEQRTPLRRGGPNANAHNERKAPKEKRKAIKAKCQMSAVSAVTVHCVWRTVRAV
jgi:hypothetical protein